VTGTAGGFWVFWLEDGWREDAAANAPGGKIAGTKSPARAKAKKNEKKNEKEKASAVPRRIRSAQRSVPGSPTKEFTLLPSFRKNVKRTKNISEKDSSNHT
jgi:hypothetical protein